MTRVLVLGYVWPEPNSSAAGRHMLSLLRLFSQQGWHVTFASPALQGEHKIDLTLEGIDELPIALNCSSFDDQLVELNPDIVLFDRFMLEEQYGWRVEQHCPDALRIVDTEDLHCLRQARQLAVRKGLPSSEVDFDTDIAKREIAAILRSDMSLIISDFEMHLLRTHFNVPENIIQHCPFMLNVEANRPSIRYSQRQHFISIGNFRHAPNWDAVLQLKQHIWPEIRKRLPHAELHVYGAYPPPKATQLHNPNERFLVKGWAPDAYAVMQSARVCLAPLRFGAGIKGKLVDAMLCNTPSVTTSVGAEGMRGELPWPGHVEDRQEDFIEAAVALYQDEAAWQHAAENTGEILRHRFDGKAIGEQIVAAIEHKLANLTSHRKANFTGAMLRHHRHRSTQYMAQWIEAKNR